MSDGSLDSFKADLEPIEFETLTNWARAAQRRNLESLRNAQGPGGAPLAPNKPYTAKRKGHERVGFDGGQMAAELLSDRGVDVDTSRGEAKVYGGSGSTDFKLNVFVRGQRDGSGVMVWVTETLPSGKQKRYQRPMLRVPGRDFFGIAEADVDAVAEKATEDIFRAWGFA